MDKLKKIKALVEQLAEETINGYPDYTDAIFTIRANGARDISITKWEKDYEVPIELRKRRELVDQYRNPGEQDYDNDRSERMNNYYSSLGCFLEEM